MKLGFQIPSLFTLLVFFQSALLAQPANDNCTGAITLTPGLSCTTTSGTTTGATASAQATDCYGSADDDVWYKFVATSTKHLVSLTGTSLTDPVLVVYGGTCANLGTPLACMDQGGFYDETAYLPNLTVGNTYFVRVYSWSSFSNGAFDICVTDVSIPPANDDCVGAITLTPAADLNCTSTVSGSTLSATQSMAPCASFSSSDDDVWYKFTATHTRHQLNMDVTASYGNFTSYVYELFSGTCSSLTSIACYEGYGIFTMNNLTVGNTYFVRLYTTDGQGQISFNLCLRTVPAAPANNECSNAITVTTSPSVSCNSTVNGSTAGATASFTNACNGNPDDDVWYKFVATNDRHIISLIGIGGATGSDDYDMVGEIFSGSCGNLTSIACGQYEFLVNNLQVGQTYFIRAYEYETGNFANFSLCVATPPAPPSNDDCAAAVTLTPAENCGAPVTGNSLGASQSTSTGGSCWGTDDDDVWYKFVATAPTHIVTVAPNTINDIVFEVLQGTCANMNTLDCVDNTGSTSEETTLTNLTVGTTYFIRVYSYYSSFASGGSFDICVSLPSPPPANDFCAGAIELTSNVGLCTTPVQGNTAGATEGTSNCFFDVNDEVWYRFTATSNAHTIAVDPGTIDDIILEISTGSNCSNLTNVACVDNTFSIGEEYTANDFVIGATYFVRVSSSSSSSGAAGTFTICLTEPGPPPANDECANVQVLTPSLTCNNPLAQTSASGTPSSTISNCSGSADDDLWYGFHATQTSHTIQVQGQADFDAVIEVTSGCQGTFLACADATFDGGLESLVLTNLTLGQLYHIRVYDYYAGGGGFTICVQGQPSSVVSVDAAQVGVRVFPNPAKGTVNIQLPETETASEIVLINAQGQRCVAVEGTLSGNQQFNTAALPAGLYMVQIYSNNRYLFSKLVVE